MVILCPEKVFVKPTPIEILPKRIRRLFYNIDTAEATEIRLRINRPIAVIFSSGEYYFVSRSATLSKSPANAVLPTKADFEEALEILTDSSLYSYQEEIKNGFITARGGHRVGICGKMTPNSDLITDISGLNYRFAREIDCLDKELEAQIYNASNIKSTIIISPPGSGKTTMLRDIVKKISNRGINISLIDERGEIAATKNGIPSFDVGLNTDVLDMCKKSVGMEMMLRSMSPRVIAVDEISKKSEFQIIREATRLGVKVFATLHGFNEIPKELINCFEYKIVLSSRNGAGTVEEARDV